MDGKEAPTESARLLEALLARPLNDDQWQLLAELDPALARLHNWRSRVRTAGCYCFIGFLFVILVASMVALAFLVLLLVPMLRPELASQLEPVIGFIGSQLLRLPMDQACLVSPTTLLPEAITMQLLRPVVPDCNFCRNLTAVPRRSNLDPAEFQREFVDARVPVVVTDGSRGWQLNHMNFDFFRSLYSPASAEEEHCQFFPYKSEFANLGQVFAMPEAQARMEPGFKPWYVGWSNCSPRVAAILRSYYSRPYFLPRESETLGTDWVFMGSPNYGAHMHVDDVGHVSWQAQVRGRKRWDLMPPLECSYQCQPISVVVEPGQVIALDTTLWYHGTRILDGDMSIAIGAEFD